MAKKRTSLDAILSSNKVLETDTTPAEPTQNNSPTLQTGKRPHVKQQALYLRLGVYRQLRLLAFEEERKMHDLCLEALDLLFANRGLPSIGELLVNDVD